MSYGTRSKSSKAVASSASTNPTPVAPSPKRAPAVKKGGVRKPSKKGAANKKAAGKQKGTAINNALDAAHGSTPDPDTAMTDAVNESTGNNTAAVNTTATDPANQAAEMNATATDKEKTDPAADPAAAEPDEEGVTEKVTALLREMIRDYNSRNPPVGSQPKFPKRKPPFKEQREGEWPDASPPRSPISPDDLDPDALLTVGADALRERDELDNAAIVTTELAEQAEAAAAGTERGSPEWILAKEMMQEAITARNKAKLASIAVRENATVPPLYSTDDVDEWYHGDAARRSRADLEGATRRLVAEEVSRTQYVNGTQRVKTDEELAELDRKRKRLEKAVAMAKPKPKPKPKVPAANDVPEPAQPQDKGKAPAANDVPEPAQQQDKGKGRADDWVPETAQPQDKGEGRAAEDKPEASNSRKRKGRDYEDDDADNTNKRPRTGEPESVPAGPAVGPSVNRKRKERDQDTQTQSQPERQSKRIRLKNETNDNIAAAADTTAATAATAVPAATSVAATLNIDPNEAIPPRQRVLCGVAGCNISANSVSELRKHYKVKHKDATVPASKEGLEFVDFIEWLNDRVAGYPPTEQAKKRYPSRLETRGVPLPQAAPPTTTTAASEIVDPAPADAEEIITAGPSETPDPTPEAAEETAVAGSSQTTVQGPAANVPVLMNHAGPATRSSMPAAGPARRAPTNAIEVVLRRIEKEGQRRLDMLTKGGVNNHENALEEFIKWNEEYRVWIREAMAKAVNHAPPPKQGNDLVDQEHLFELQRKLDEREDEVEDLKRKVAKQAKVIGALKKELGK